MAHRPVIGIITNQELDPHYLFPGYPRVTINDDYPRSVRTAGGVPLLLPPAPELDALPEQLALLDGLVLSGGVDVDPFAYGQQPVAECGTPCPVRDEFELAALRWAREHRLPVLGICRGLQVANVFLGGTLHQDLRLAGFGAKHMALGNPALPVHEITVQEGSFLHDAWGVTSARVNSFHHQAVDRLGAGLRVVARSTDGVVEAVQHTGGFPLVAVQWHPEMMSGADERARQLFGWFVGRAGERWRRDAL